MSPFPVLTPSEPLPQHLQFGESADEWEVHGEDHIHPSEPKSISNPQHWRLLCRILGCLRGEMSWRAPQKRRRPAIRTANHIPVQGLCDS
jgi:hypothetical protein